MAYRATRLTEDRKTQTRDAILNAGRALVTSGGFRALSIAAVAAGAGVATGNVYRYFRNKSHLCVAIFERATEREIAAVFAAPAPHAGARQQLAQALTLFAERALAKPVLAYALIAEPVGPELEQARLDYRGNWTSHFATLISAGIASGDFVDQAAELAASAIVGAMAETVIHQTAPFTMTPAHIAPLVDFCLRGLSAHPE